MNVTLPYNPRSAFHEFHQRTNRWALLVAHRRSGKTVACVNDLVVRALHTSKKKARFGYIAPFRSQAKAVAWEYLKEAVKDFAVKVRESDLRVELPNGAWISLYGADNPDSLRGLYFDGLVLDEFADMRPALWGSVILPTLADRKGWIVIIGTPKGHNLFYEFRNKSIEDEKWYHLTLKASVSDILDEEELEHLRDTMSDAQYQQEMECSFDAPVLGTYYAHIIERLENCGQIAPNACSYDPEFKVYVSSDLGYTDSTAFWFWQQRPDGLAIIKYYENSGQELQHYVDFLNHQPYEYEKLWLPHDARAKTLQTGKSTVEQLLDAGFPCDIVPSLKKQHGIDAARLVLNSCYFDTLECFSGIEALRAYRRKWDNVNKKFSNEPLHDWSSDGCLAGETMVDTTDGLVRIDSIQAGMQVLIAGKAALVERRSFNGVKSTIKIEFTDGTSVIATKDHKFFTTSGLFTADTLTVDSKLLTSEGVKPWAESKEGIREAFKVSTVCCNDDVTKTVKRITDAGLRPVYDLTISLDHAYVANGLACSNSDAFRYLALVAQDGIVKAPKRMAVEEKTNIVMSTYTLQNLFDDNEQRPKLSITKMRI